MIQKNEINGKYRARWNFGHTSFYKKLLKQIQLLEKEVADSGKPATSTVENSLSKITADISRLELKYGAPVDIKTRRSFVTRHEWQAKQAEELFEQAFDFESE